jgi:flagellar hook-associated protein 2
MIGDGPDMGQITSSVGLVSGINTGDIINQLIAIEQQPVTQLQTRISSLAAQKAAYTSLSSSLTSIQQNAQTLAKASTFQNATATSSDDTVVSATASAGAAQGSYQLQVARLVTTQQVISAGVQDFNSTKIGAGTITVGVGGGELTSTNNLNDLNGGAGVRRGQFRITDRAGESTVVDISDAVTLQDVVKKINTALDVQVQASVQGGHLVLSDISGKALNDLTVTDVGGGHAAQDLGIAGNSNGTTTLTGTDINEISRTTSLALLNDGNGIRTADSGDDFSITPGDGSAAIKVNLGTATTVGDVLDAINTAGAGKVQAAISPDGSGIQLTDISGGGGAMTVTALNGSEAAQDLGIDTTGTGTIVGRDVMAGLGTVLLSSLNGGSGLTAGTIAIKDRADSASINVDLSGATSVQDIIDTINNSGAKVQASISDGGDGINITDTSGGTGLLQIDDVSGNTAQSLGLAGSFDTSTTVVKGANLHRQYVSNNTLLKDYNGGKGVATGSIKITNSAGVSNTISIGTSQVTLGDVISQINVRDMGVTASINADGNGILLTDTAGGAGQMQVSDVDSTTAKDLLIAGTATNNAIDGAQQKTIDVTANDTLATLQSKINGLNFGVSANIINDGSGTAPFRLSLTARNSGLDGRVMIDSGTTSLNTQTLVQAQNAAVFLGGVGSEQPLLITSSSNQISGAIQGVNITLNGVSDNPVTLNVSQNADNAVTQINSMVTTFNSLVDAITQLTSFDTTTNQASLLLGDSTTQEIQNDLYTALSAVEPTNGKYRILADVGFSLDDKGHMVFDENAFRAAYADDPTGVQQLFGGDKVSAGLTTRLDSLNNNEGVNSSGGDDIHFLLHNGSSFNISLNGVDTLGDVVDLINTTSNGKVTASLGLNGNLVLNDTTSGGAGSTFSVSNINGSTALHDLGLDVVPDGNILTGNSLINSSAAINRGIGGVIDNTITNLTDPVSGVITRENQTLDNQTQEFNDRISELNDLIDQKRQRLEDQFANMESVLAGLKSQQSALSSFTPVKAA